MLRISLTEGKFFKLFLSTGVSQSFSVLRVKFIKAQVRTVSVIKRLLDVSDEIFDFLTRKIGVK